MSQYTFTPYSKRHLNVLHCVCLIKCNTTMGWLCTALCDRQDGKCLNRLSSSSLQMILLINETIIRCKAASEHKCMHRSDASKCTCAPRISGSKCKYNQSNGYISQGSGKLLQFRRNLHIITDAKRCSFSSQHF